MPKTAASMYRESGLLFVLFLFFLFRFVFVFFLFVIFLDVVLVLFFLFLFIIVQVVGDRVQMDGMRLGYFQFDFTFWAAQDFALLNFILIHIYFGATIGAANHGSILRTNIRGAEPGRIATATDRRIIYRE
jgi:hypothetical protein